MLSARTASRCDHRPVISRAVRLTATAIVLALAPALLAAPAAGAGTGRVSIGAGLEGPRGLHATVYAKGLEHVAALTIDGEGRLWVATAAAKDEGDDGIYLVADDGTPRLVVDDVHTPLGLVWVGDTLYATEAGGVLALGGFDGATFASRVTIVAFPEGTGEVNGIVAGADGRLYVGISAPCNACTPTDERSGSIVSFRPDGSDARVFASGIRAPIGLARYPGTDDLFVTMNQRDDLGAKTPGDWLAVVEEGQSWGFPSCYGQHSAKCASVPSPVAELHEHAAVSGVALLTGQLGASVGTGAVVAEWVTGQVRLVRLTTTAHGYQGTTTTLLTGFRNPVPVLLDAHGALFVGDWTSGKVYRITA
jgi:glucose/arabinose dehydrogenase